MHRQILIARQVGQRKPLAQRIGGKRDVADDIGTGRGGAIGLAIDKEIDRAGVTRMQCGRHFCLGQGVALARIEDALEYHAAIGATHPHPCGAHGQNFDNRRAAVMHTWRAIIRGTVRGAQCARQRFGHGGIGGDMVRAAAITGVDRGNRAIARHHDRHIQRLRP